MDAMTLASTAVALLAGNLTPTPDAPTVSVEEQTGVHRGPRDRPCRRGLIQDAVRRALDADEGEVLIELAEQPADLARLLGLARALRARLEDDSALREELDRIVATMLQAPASALSGSWHFAYLLQDYADDSRLAGRWGEALLAYEQSRAIMIELGDLAGAARGLNNLGAAHEDRGELAQAALCFTRCGATFTELGDARAAALTLINLGNVRHRQGCWEEAAECFERGAGQLAAMGDVEAAVHARTNLALVLHDRGYSERALTVLEDCYRDLAERGDLHGGALVLVDLASVHEEIGHWDAALQCQRRGAQMLADLGEREEWSRAMSGLCRLHQQLGQWEEAAASYRAVAQY
jgi:tetratricopeptide (TPR) repeat protein